VIPLSDSVSSVVKLFEPPPNRNTYAALDHVNDEEGDVVLLGLGSWLPSL
jgi:hypothetical protein